MFREGAISAVSLYTRGILDPLTIIRLAAVLSAGFGVFFFRAAFPFPFQPFVVMILCLFVGDGVLVFCKSAVRNEEQWNEYLWYLYSAGCLIGIGLTGGFLSPFIVLAPVLVGLRVIRPGIHPRWAMISAGVLATACPGIALAQKFDIVACPAGFACALMQKNPFFFSLIFVHCIALASAFLIGHRHRMSMQHRLTTLLESCQQILGSTSTLTGQDFFSHAVRMLASTCSMQHAVIAAYEHSRRSIRSCAVWSKGGPAPNFELPVKSTIFEVVLQQGHFLCRRMAAQRFPDDTFLASLGAQAFRGVCLNDPSGKALGILCVLDDSIGGADDLSESLLQGFACRVSAELQRHHDLNHRNQNDMQFEQARKLEAIGQLAGGVAHDFNNLLSGIVGYAGLMKRKPDDAEKVLEYTEKIGSLTERGASLTRQLLTFARKGKYRTEPVDLHMMLEEVTSILRHTIDRRISIEQVFTAESSLVLGEPSQVQNLFLNLALNARDAMPEGGKLTFGSRITVVPGKVTCGYANLFDVEPGEYVQVSVADTGCGISADILSRIFEPFFTTKLRGKGTGLGLAAVYGCVKSHHGFMDVSSSIGKGTTFYVSLPLTGNTGRFQETTAMASAPNLERKHLVVVDDEKPVLETIAEHLRTYGAVVVAYNTVAEALDYFNRHAQSIDCVLLDMIMPGMNGRELFCEMKKVKPDLRAVLISGYSLEKEAQEILVEGIADIIEKPVNARVLACTIDQVLHPSRSPAVESAPGA